MGELYKKLFALKKNNSALWNGKWGARMIQVPNSAPLQVLSFVRQDEKEKVFAVFNFSAEPQSVTFKDSLFHGKYTDYINGNQVEFSASAQLDLKPWEYHIFVK